MPVCQLWQNTICSAKKWAFCIVNKTFECGRPDAVCTAS